MKCNYKRYNTVGETILTLNDTKHFNEFGANFTVGECYPNYINHHDATTLSLNFEGLMVIQTLYKPTSTEIMNFKCGNLNFALAEDNNILFLLSKFGTNNWSSSCMNYSLNIEASQLNNNITTIPMLLFDTSNGKLLAIRVVSVDNTFVKKINDGIRKQLTTPYSFAEFSRIVNSTYRKYPTDDDLLKDAYYFYNPSEKN